MNINLDRKTVGRLGLPAGLLVLYFLDVSWLEVSLVVPYAFLWLMSVLIGIKSHLEKQRV